MAKRLFIEREGPVALEWQERAACKGMDQNIFYGPDAPESTQERVAREEKAKAVCYSCPVRRQCLDYALRHNEVYGIWGGMTERERRNLKSAQEKTQTKTGERRVS